MPAVYEKLGIEFKYPENWTLDEQEAMGGTEPSVTVYSPDGGAFWSIVVHPLGGDPEKLAQAAVKAMRQVYSDLDYEAAEEVVFGQELIGYDMNFYCLDLTNTALVRGFRTEEATYIILCQAEDREFTQVEPVFRAITASLLRFGVD